jgi:hypothetical protein
MRLTRRIPISDLQQQIEERVANLTTALSQESVRGKILVLTVQIDDLLSAMLKRIMKPARATRKKDDDLFGPMAPLASFSSHITMAYRLGLICERDASALDFLRNLRNDCAHTTKAFSLEEQPNLGRFVEFTTRTCQKDNLFLCIGGVICPRTTEDWLVMVCICHIVYMEATLEKLEQIPDRYFVPTNRVSARYGAEANKTP